MIDEAEHRKACKLKYCTLHSRLSPVKICRARRWRPGDIIEGDEGHGPHRIVITAIGERSILARCIDDGRSEGMWTLSCRCWRKVGRTMEHAR